MTLRVENSVNLVGSEGVIRGDALVEWDEHRSEFEWEVNGSFPAGWCLTSRGVSRFRLDRGIV